MNELTSLPHDVQAFPDFYEERRTVLGERISRNLASGVVATPEVEEVEEYDGTELDAALED